MIDFLALFANPIFNFVFSAVTFLLGNIFAYWLYRRGINRKQIWWDVHCTNLTHPYFQKLKNINIQYDKDTIYDISVLRLMIWNSGSDVIRQEDIAKNHPINFIADEETRFLDAKLIASNNDSIVINLHKEENEVAIDFEYLEANQGLVVEILYTGSLDNLGVSGAVKGGSIGFKNAQSEFMTRPPFVFLTSKLSYSARRKALILFTGFCGFFLFVFFLPLAIEAAFNKMPTDSGFWFVVPRMGFTAVMYFVIMTSIWRTPKIPVGLEIFEGKIG